MGDKKEGARVRRSESTAIVSILLPVLLFHWLKLHVESKIQDSCANISKTFETR